MTAPGVGAQFPGPSEVAAAGVRIPAQRVRPEAAQPWESVDDQRSYGQSDWITPTDGVRRRRIQTATLLAGVGWLVLLVRYPVPALTASVGMLALAALSWSAHRAGTPVVWLRIGVLFAAVAAVAVSGCITALLLG